MKSTGPASLIYKARSRRKSILNFLGGAAGCVLVVALNRLFFGHAYASRNTAMTVFMLLVLLAAVVGPVLHRYGSRLKRLVFEESYVNESAFSASWSFGAFSERESSSAAARKYHWLQMAVVWIVGYFAAALVLLAVHFMLRP